MSSIRRVITIPLCILLFALALALSSCNDLGIGFRYSLDEATHNKIVVEQEKECPSYLIYNNEKYVFAGDYNHVRIDGENSKQILIGWNGNRWFGYLTEFYSYSTDSPLFIVSPYLGVFFREGYDYMQDTYVLSDTNCDVKLIDLYSPERITLSWEKMLVLFFNPRNIPLFS